MNQYKSKFDKQIANEQKAIREKEEARVFKKNRKRNYKVKKERPKNNKTSCVKRNCVIIPKKLRQKLNKPQKIPAPSRDYDKSSNHKGLIVLIIIVVVFGLIYFIASNQDNESTNNTYLI